MSRFIQVKQPVKKKPEAKVLTKPGKYTAEELKKTKPIYSSTGGKY